MATLNLQVSTSRDRFQTLQDNRVHKLKIRDQQRQELIRRQHAARWSEMDEQLSKVVADEQHTHDIKESLKERFMVRSIEVHDEEHQKRLHFLQGREKCLQSQDSTHTQLRAEIFLTPSPNHSPRNVSPEHMSSAVRLRLMPMSSPRRPEDPLQSKQALLLLQSKRDEQVEQQRLLQEQQLAEKRRKRDEQTTALRERLEDIVKRTQEENKEKMRKKQAVDARIHSWRWRKHHELRVEAIARLEANESPSSSNGKRHASKSDSSRNAPLPPIAPHAHSNGREPSASGTEPKESAIAPHDGHPHANNRQPTENIDPLQTKETTQTREHTHKEESAQQEEHAHVQQKEEAHVQQKEEAHVQQREEAHVQQREEAHVQQREEHVQQNEHHTKEAEPANVPERKEAPAQNEAPVSLDDLEEL